MIAVCLAVSPLMLPSLNDRSRGRKDFIMPTFGETKTKSPASSTHTLTHADVIKGSSAGIVRVRHQLEQFAALDAGVLILGETGTGKELVAKALHAGSARHDKPFVAINCGAYPNDLILNEFFGHERGAFTGAVSRQEGLAARAEGGTLFLDEVDSLSQHAQVVLLRFLQDRRYRRLGGSQEFSADIRLIAAAHCDLVEHVQKGGFRDDLFYRLDVLRIELPPLRERREDIVRLATHFLQRLAESGQRSAPVITPAFQAWMLAHAWPGNVRELENVILRWLHGLAPDNMTHSPHATPSLENALDGLERIARLHALQMPLTQAKTAILHSFERHYIAHLLELTHGNITQAARRAGKERRAFGRLVKKHGLGDGCA
ncbi:Putative transcriptional regulator [gamma proteobacterium HdN1]|nr:Putative transcriptional regulator [gamma proteobacterium HdN1]